MTPEASALTVVERLQRLLEQEFKALEARDLEKLEALTEKREALLTQLLYVKETHATQWRSDSFLTVRTTLEACQSLHKRNEMLLARQLDVVKQALGALRKSSDDGDLYNRLGHLARRRANLFADDV